jgi:hypothetical protein
MRRHLSRRTLTTSAATLLATASMALLATAREATPASGGTPVPSVTNHSLNELVGSIPPKDLLATLQTAPVTTSLFPADYGESMVDPWEDDADLAGSLGGVLVSGVKAPLMIAFIVFPDEAAAMERLAQLASESEEAPVETTILAHPGITFLSMFGPRTIVQVGNVHIWGFGMPILSDPVMESAGEGPDPAYVHLLEARSVFHATIALDHLWTVVSP